MNFDHILLRLKQQLGVSSDKDVAAALGLSKTAFAERKRRGAFPEGELAVLAGKNGNLNLTYILTGDTRELVMRKIHEDLHEAKTRAETIRHPDMYSVKEVVGKYANREDELLRIFRAASEAGKNVILATARAIDQNK